MHAAIELRSGPRERDLLAHPSCRAGLWRDRRGATALEFAIVLPVLILLTLGILEFGRALFVKHSLEYAVSNVSREAMVDLSLTDQQLMDMIRAEMSAVDAATVTVQVTRPVIDGLAYVVLDASYPFALSIPLFGFAEVALTSTARAPVSG